MSGGTRWAAAIGAVALTALVAPGTATARLRWSGCGDVEAECARVSVPLDRSGTVKGSVRLRVARYGEPSRKPTLLYLSGGPGGAGVREFADVLFEVGPLARRYQLVSYDQRGTGSSGLIRCPALERDPRLRSMRAGAGCAARLGARRGLYRTDDSVEDVEALRQALGVEKLTLFGISYGTKLALAYARAHPDHVARLALDSVLDPDDADAFGLEPYRAMGPSLAALCPARCRGVSTDPARDLAQLADRLRAAPMHGLVYGMRGRGRPATLTALGLSDLMFDADYNPAIRAGIPVGVRAALDHRDPRRCCGCRRPPRACRRCRGRARSRPLATPRCARRRRCRGRAGRRSASARRGRRPRRTGSGPARSSRSATRRRAPTRSTSACAGPRRRPPRRPGARIPRCRR